MQVDDNNTQGPNNVGYVKVLLWVRRHFIN